MKENWQDLAYELALARRDEQALWNHEKNLEIALAARACGAWYRGEKGARVPDVFLSAVTRPAGDGDKKGAHRILSLARNTRQHLPVNGEAFARFRISCYLVLDELAKVVRLPQLETAATLLDEYFAYLERKSADPEEDVRFGAVVQEKAQRYCTICEEISAAFAQHERALLGEASADPFAAQVASDVQETLRGVRGITRRLRHPPPSGTTLRWVEAKWTYYKAHPEALPGDVARRRVYARDVWPVIEKEAREKHDVADFAAFASILASIRQIHHRKRIQ